MSDPSDEQYFLRVEQHFGRRRGGPLVLSPNDWGLLEGWRQQGIPLRVVLRGINQAFDRFAAAGPRPDRINSLRYCEQEVQAAWEEHRAASRRPAGEQQASGALPAASRHLAGVAAACRAAAAALAGDAASCLHDAAVALEAMETRARDGSSRAYDIDAAAGELERQVHETLRALAASEPALAELEELELPRFSPYEAL